MLHRYAWNLLPVFPLVFFQIIYTNFLSLRCGAQVNFLRWSGITILCASSSYCYYYSTTSNRHFFSSGSTAGSPKNLLELFFHIFHFLFTYRLTSPLSTGGVFKEKFENNTAIRERESERASEEERASERERSKWDRAVCCVGAL